MIAPAELRAIPCPLCGATESEARFVKHGLRVVRCTQCGLVFTNPQPSPEALVRLYNAQAMSPTDYYVQYADADAASFRPRLALIERYQRPGRLLDVGCGSGTLLALARERGWQGRGIDVNAASIAHCRAQGLEAIVGSFPHPAFAGLEFDAVVLNDVLEHLVDPRAALTEVRRLLAPGGVLFVTTPDVGAVVARLSGRRWVHLKPSEHLVYFDRRTIARLLGGVGFTIVECRSMGRVRSLALVLDRLATYSRMLSRVVQAVVPARVAGRVTFAIDPGDEMAVLARRT